MPFTLRSFHRFSRQYTAASAQGPFQDQDTVWNLYLSEWWRSHERDTAID